MMRCSSPAPKCAPRKFTELEADVSLGIKKGKTKEVLIALLDDNINVKDSQTGDTALHLNINAANTKGQSPIHVAIFHRNLTALNQLLKKSDKLQPGVCDCNGNNILHYASTKTFSAKEAQNILKRLQKHHGDLSYLITQQNSTGNTPLHEAVAHGSMELEKFFILRKPELLSCRNAAGETPLDISLRLKRDSQAAMVLSQTLPEIYPADMLSPIIESNMDQLLEQLFVALSLEPSRRKNVSVLGHTFTIESLQAVESRFKEINCQITENKGTYVHLCIIKKKIEILKVLLSRPEIDLTLQDNEGNTALHVALDTKNYNNEIVRLLLDWYYYRKQLSEGRIKPKKKMKDNENCPVWTVYAKTVINKQNRQGQTPLIRAFLCGMEETNLMECVQQLIDLSADVTLSDQKGNTPLYYATYQRKIKCVGILRSAGASSEAINSDGVSPLDLALKGEDDELVNALTADIEVLPKETKSKKIFW